MSTENQTNKKEYPVDPEELRRYEICLKCKLFDPDGTKCRACGCNVLPNLQSTNFLCPMRKW